MRTNPESTGVDAGVVGAIDIGGTKIALALVTPTGLLVSQDSFATQPAGGMARGMQEIVTRLRKLLDAQNAALLGIGVGCSGPVDPFSGVIGRVGNLPGWEGCNLKERLSTAFAVPVLVENDADAAALGEYLWGSGKAVERYLYVTLSTGIGTGFIVRGELYRGRDGAHPEMGHHTIDRTGPACYCGATGCWESLASGLAIGSWASNQSSSTGMTGREVFAAYDRGDAVGIAAVERLRLYVGLGLANLTTILLPDVIALSGGLCARADTFLAEAIGTMRRACGEVPVDQTEVRLAELGADVALLGAAAVWVLAYGDRQTG